MEEIMITNLVFPIIMLLIGHWFSFFKQKRSMYAFGYRSFMSMKSDETWDHAQNLASKVFMFTGFIDLIIALLSDDYSLILFEIITLMISMVIIEGRLYYLFDLHGRRKH